jgi:hypothetical protein
MKNSLETRLGLFFALVFVAAFVLFEMVGGGRFFGGGIPIKARFNTAGDLKVGGPSRAEPSTRAPAGGGALRGHAAAVGSAGT